MSAAADISSRIERPDGVRRLGQALWMMIGRPVEQTSLLWARGLLGANGDALLWRGLVEEEALRQPDFVLRPQQLARFLCSLWDDEKDAERPARLVWTLPRHLAVEGIVSDSYLRAAIELVDSSVATLTLVSPYLEPTGMGRLHRSLIEALHRGVVVRLLTHDVEDRSSLASASLEALRRDSIGLAGSLTVFTASTTPQVLLHLKIIVADDSKAIVGSANVTGKGFGSNLEAGVVLGQEAAIQIERVVQATVTGALVQQIFSTKA
ncbi:phospholipase D family protein [Burkholderia ubonensis]|uniref:phospholipase D family protein n=1 Tax=Burkholderia ubonensis TaxID=101571 RepID=UPI000F574009|nr:phospholipase D family protein [Burkholderia ubonensis]RQP38383.1 hypothetical protein DF155_08810 [Burkholderia ubonensis]RQP38702.1 hypothetical protein DF154_16585 [Burkholderia ubonensis]RQP42839.1 hypothetical protein DF156_11750 [Burkholderia ubonensis]RQP57225.1 hypothetical protein DF144_09325 [Burkholderia ubonensis]RQP62153.1 hypothetical protein DF159_14180 [Burkholderia ubonensis]